MKKKDKKPFKETKLGQFLKDKAPNILNSVGDLLPDNGALGVVKNLISSDDKMQPQDKVKALDLLKVEVELFELEVRDRENARNREIEIAKTGKTDWFMYLVGVAGLAAFLFSIYAVVFIESVKTNELFIHLLGMIEGVVIGNIFAYYFGGSK